MENKYFQKNSNKWKFFNEIIGKQRRELYKENS